jgi:hypothetical protein
VATRISKQREWFFAWYPPAACRKGINVSMNNAVSAIVLVMTDKTTRTNVLISAAKNTSKLYAYTSFSCPSIIPWATKRDDSICEKETIMQTLFKFGGIADCTRLRIL